MPLYDIFREHLEKETRLGAYAPFLAGAASRSLAVLICSPLELVRTRMQVSARNLLILILTIFRSTCEEVGKPRESLIEIAILFQRFAGAVSQSYVFPPEAIEKENSKQTSDMSFSFVDMCILKPGNLFP
jgi:hypothetical protein